jgi:nucleotide-binding universal stress UspA family protein
VVYSDMWTILIMKCRHHTGLSRFFLGDNVEE